MKICPNCNSDMIEKDRSMLWLRIVIAVLLLFVPFGLFLVWIPFVFPYNYICKSCGVKVDEPREIDWREFEKLKLELQNKDHSNNEDEERE